MKKAEDIPEDLVIATRAAASAVPLTQNLSDEALRALLVVAWDYIYAFGYTDGFSSQEQMEINVELLDKNGWAPHATVWFDGATTEQADKLMDLALDAVDAAVPEGVAVSSVQTLRPGTRKTPPPSE